MDTFLGILAIACTVYVTDYIFGSEYESVVQAIFVKLLLTGLLIYPAIYWNII